MVLQMARHDREELAGAFGGRCLQHEQERRYMVGAVKSVHRCLVSSGSGWMDAEPEIAEIGALLAARCRGMGFDEALARSATTGHSKSHRSGSRQAFAEGHAQRQRNAGAFRYGYILNLNRCRKTLAAS